MPKKQSSSKTSTLASKVLSGSKKPTAKEVKSLAASALSQDETKGRRKAKKEALRRRAARFVQMNNLTNAAGRYSDDPGCLPVSVFFNIT